MTLQKRPCGCQGYRYCLFCENKVKLKETSCEEIKISFIFCPHCALAFRAQVEVFQQDNCDWHHALGNVPHMPFPGVSIYVNFISEIEETGLLEEIEKRPWALSQSGRRKQDYGPKCNFKKKKLKLASFTGFPPYIKPVVEAFNALPELSNYLPVEHCNLDYEPSRGSAIDPHFDDFWVWGERLATLNLLSDSFLTMTVPPEKIEAGVPVEALEGLVLCDESISGLSPTCFLIHLPMPRRSLIALFGPARFTWRHEIRRQDIVDRRIAVTFREVNPDFLPGGPSENIGEELLRKAASYEGLSRVEVLEEA